MCVLDFFNDTEDITFPGSPDPSAFEFTQERLPMKRVVTQGFQLIIPIILLEVLPNGPLLLVIALLLQ